MTLAKIFEAIQGLPAQIVALMHDAKDAAAKLLAAETRANDAEAKVTKLEADLKGQVDRNAVLITERDKALADVSARDEQITKLNAGAKTIEQQATEQVAALGIAPLPVAGADAKNESADALRVQLAKETDPARRMELARKLREARGITF